jgi:Uma2 family endonuclease
MTTTSTRPITFEQYLTYDDSTDRRFEFDHGKLVEMPPATRLHNLVMMFLSFCLQTEIKNSHYAYCVSVNSTEIFNGCRTRRPDILVMTIAQSQSLGNQPDILYSPCLLVVEVVSPTCRSVDTIEKRDEYAKFDISEYWIVDFTLGIFSVLTLEDGVYIEKIYKQDEPINSNLFPKISLTMNQVMQSV